jgi:hypothetical protein
MPNYIMFGNTGASVAYYNQLVIYADTIALPVSLVAPDDGTADAGFRTSTTDLYMSEIVSWEAVTGATSYQLQVAHDEEFNSLDANSGYTTGQQLTCTNLIPGKTYYWRVRVAQEPASAGGDVRGAPVIGPWSEARDFTVGEIVVEVVVPFGIISPDIGATGVATQPSFAWTAVEGAEGYEIVVAEDPTFAIIDWSRSTASPFYKADEALAYSTTYYWRVRAVPDGEWANGMFTTEAVPAEPVEPIVIEPTPPPEVEVIEVPVAAPAAPIPSYLLWTIIGVGAVLVIALIVLIVRTRRVT